MSARRRWIDRAPEHDRLGVELTEPDARWVGVAMIRRHMFNRGGRPFQGFQFIATTSPSAKTNPAITEAAKSPAAALFLPKPPAGFRLIEQVAIVTDHENRADFAQTTQQAADAAAEAVAAKLASEKLDNEAMEAAAEYVAAGPFAGAVEADDIDTRGWTPRELRAMADHIAAGGSALFAENTAERAALQPLIDRTMASVLEAAWRRQGGAPPVTPPDQGGA